jgi:hypothetical protein
VPGIRTSGSSFTGTGVHARVQHAAVATTATTPVSVLNDLLDTFFLL